MGPRARRLLPTLAFALLLTGGLRADTIKLADGTSVNGRATAYDGEAKVLTVRTDSGELKQIPMAQLHARSVYQLHRSLVRVDNAQGQLQLADFARDAGLYAHSARHYRQAAAADASLAAEVETQLARLRQEAAAYCMQQARDAVDRGDLGEAEHWLDTLVLKLPDEPQAAEAAALLEAHYRAARDARDDAVEAADAELYAKGLAEARRHYDAMVEKTRQGLTSKNLSQSQTRWQGALQDGRATLDALDQLAAASASAQDLEQISVYRGIVVGQVVEIHLHTASAYATRSSYNKALAEVNQALALQPDNAQALSLRARIVDASSRGLRWLW